MAKKIEPKVLTKWQVLLADLKKLGWSQKLIGQHCKVSQAAINQLNIGKSREPRHSLGESLLALQGIDASEYELLEEEAALIDMNEAEYADA